VENFFWKKSHTPVVPQGAYLSLRCPGKRGEFELRWRV